MIVFCREISKETGEIGVYALPLLEVTSETVQRLGLRQRLNGELQYFITTESIWKERGGEICKILKRRILSERAIERMGGIIRVE